MSQNYSFLLLTVTIFLLVGIKITNCQIPLRITVVPSKYLLSSTDQSVLLQCYGNENVNENTSVIFSLGSTVIYNSTDNLIGSGVSLQNYTTIRYSRITSGVVDVNCQVGTTVSSNRLTLPYISQLTLTHEPLNFTLTQPFLATCAVGLAVLAPNFTSYAVNFYLGSTEIARWTMAENYAPIFTRPAILPSLDVIQGTAVAPNFVAFYSAQMTPKTAASRGQYYCRISVAIDVLPLIAYSDNSNIWNTTSGGWQVMPSFLLMSFAIFFFVNSNFDFNLV